MKKPFLVICNLLVLLLLSGCFSSIDREERKLAEQALNEAIPMIHEHFKNKYAIDVDINSAVAEFSGCSHDSERCFTGLVEADVTYNDEKISVQVLHQIVYDNYQADEIEQACLNYALEKLNLPKPSLYKISPETRFVNDYFDGTNAETVFNMISPSFLLIYDGDIVFDSDFYERLTALSAHTEYAKQSMEFVILKKGSADKVSLEGWSELTVNRYAPYVDYSIDYSKNENLEPVLHQYPIEPFPGDLPIFKEFLSMRSGIGSGNFLVLQEEPSKGWDIESDFEQITPSCRLLWNGDEWDFHHIFIPSSVWKELYETYDEIYLIKFREYANGEISYLKDLMKPDNTEYSGVTLYGDFFYFNVDKDTKYITFFGIRK